jgi:hypothetical protein
MLISDLNKMMGATRMVFEADSGGSKGGSTVLAGGLNGDTGATDTGTGGDGDTGSNGDKGSGASYGDWRDQVSTDLRGSDFVKGYEGKTISDLVREHMDVQGKAEKFTPPSEDASSDERSQWLKGIMADAGFSIPESGEGYELTKPDIPDGMHYDEDMVNFMLNKFAELGVSKELGQAIVKAYDDAQVSQFQADRKKALDYTKNLEVEMMKEYGDDYKSVAETAFRAAKTFGGDELTKLLDEETLDGKRVGDHPIFVRTFHNIAKAISEDKAGVWLEKGGAPGDSPYKDKRGNPTLEFTSMVQK